MTPAPDAGREPSEQAVEAAVRITSGIGDQCIINWDAPNEHVTERERAEWRKVTRQILEAAYAVDCPASQPGELTDEEIAGIAHRFAENETLDSNEKFRGLMRASLSQGFLGGWYFALTGKVPQSEAARALSPAPKEGT